MCMKGSTPVAVIGKQKSIPLSFSLNKTVMNEAYFRKIEMEWEKLMNTYIIKLKKKLLAVNTRTKQIKIT